MNHTYGWMWMPPDFSTHGDRLDSLNFWLHVLMLVLFVGWGIFFVYTLFRFRRGRNPKADYEGVKSHTSTYLEVAVALIEGVLLFGLSIPLWGQRVNIDFLYEDVDAAQVRDDVEEIKVIAQQFQWNIHYPGPDGKFGQTKVELVNEETNPIGLDEKNDPAAKDDIWTVGTLAIPVGKPILIHLRTKDVIHSFSLPVLRVKQDAIPGMDIPLWFEATKTSAEYKQAVFDQAKAAGDTELESPADVPDFQVACAQLCGLTHYSMRGTLLLQTDEEFQKWLAEQKNY